MVSGRGLLFTWAGFYLLAGWLARFGPLVQFLSPPFILLGLSAVALATDGSVRRVPTLFRWRGLMAVLAGTAAGGGLWLGGTGIAWLEQRFWHEVQPNNPLLLRPGLFGTPVHLAAFMLVAVVLAPVAEELFYRGLLYGWLSERLPVTAAAALSGLAFGAGHLIPTLILPLALIGWGLAWVCDRARSLWPAVAAHATLNALSLVVAWAYLYR